VRPTAARPRVCLIGHDGFGWAHDEDLRLTGIALQDREACALTDLARADVVHAAWWAKLATLPDAALRGRRIVCHTSDDPWIEIFGVPAHRRWRQVVGLWITRNAREQRMFDRLGLRHVMVPLMIDVSLSHPVAPDDARLAELRARWRIPSGRYLIGSFQRDGDVSDVARPRLKKGPDLFAEIAAALLRRGLPVHVVLAGPRRHWLRRRLDGLGVPTTFVGQDVPGDDMAVNTQSRETLNLLYNLVDVCVVTSRYEGAPDQVLAAAAAGCKLISPVVGTAPDIVDAGGLYRSLPEAIELLSADIRDGVLAKYVPGQLQRILDHHRPETVAPLLRAVYDRIDDVPLVPGRRVTALPLHAQLARARRAVARAVPRGKSTRVALWCGPANDGFWGRLAAALRERGLDVGGGTASADVHLVDGASREALTALACYASVRVIHRIGRLWTGPRTRAAEIAATFNTQIATTTVFDSGWLLERALDDGYAPASPMIIPPAPDPAIFVSPRRAVDGNPRRFRLLAVRGQDEASAARWARLDERLDARRFACTVVTTAPAAPADRATLMRAHDIYVELRGDGAGRETIVEGLMCGLPVVFIDEADNGEVVGFGGHGFASDGDPIACLEQVAESYERLVSLLTPPTFAGAVEKYATLIDEVVRGRWGARDALDVP